MGKGSDMMPTSAGYSADSFPSLLTALTFNAPHWWNSCPILIKSDAVLPVAATSHPGGGREADHPCRMSRPVHGGREGRRLIEAFEEIDLPAVAARHPGYGDGVRVGGREPEILAGGG